MKRNNLDIYYTSKVLSILFGGLSIVALIGGILGFYHQYGIFGLSLIASISCHLDAKKAKKKILK